MSTQEREHEETKEAPVEEYIQTPSRIPVIQQLSVALGILALIFGTSYTGDFLDRFQKSAEEPQEPYLEAQIPHVPEEQPEDYFHDITIEGQSAFVWDIVAQKTLYSKNPDRTLPLASVTKLMTALVAYELLDTDDTINISMEAIREDGDSGLHDGEVFSFQNLTDLILVTSSNDGAHALAAAAGNSLFQTENGMNIFVEAMNIRAKEIGLTQTRFHNATGLDLSELEPGAVGSARDMTFLLEYIITHYPDLVARTNTGTASIPNNQGEAHMAQNTNEAVQNIQGLIASKTGYTDLAGGNLVVAFEAGLNRPVIVSVLGSGIESRFRDVTELVEAARLHIVHNN